MMQSPTLILFFRTPFVQHFIFYAHIVQQKFRCHAHEFLASEYFGTNHMMQYLIFVQFLDTQMPIITYILCNTFHITYYTLMIFYKIFRIQDILILNHCFNAVTIFQGGVGVCA